MKNRERRNREVAGQIVEEGQMSFSPKGYQNSVSGRAMNNADHFFPRPGFKIREKGFCEKKSWARLGVLICLTRVEPFRILFDGSNEIYQMASCFQNLS